MLSGSSALMILGAFLSFWKASETGGTVLFQLAWLVWGVGAGLLCAQAKALSSKPLLKDRQVGANGLFAIGAVFYVFGCFFYYSKHWGTRMFGVAVFFMGAFVLVAGGVLLLWEAIAANEGSLEADKLSLGALAYFLAGIFLWFGSIFLMKADSHQAGIASFLIAAIAYTTGSVLIYLAMSDPEYGNPDAVSAGSSTSYNKPYQPSTAQSLGAEDEQLL